MTKAFFQEMERLLLKKLRVHFSLKKTEQYEIGLFTEPALVNQKLCQSSDVHSINCAYPSYIIDCFFSIFTLYYLQMTFLQYCN